jgi:hypothetical protein
VPMVATMSWARGSVEITRLSMRPSSINAAGMRHLRRRGGIRRPDDCEAGGVAERIFPLRFVLNAGVGAPIPLTPVPDVSPTNAGIRFSLLTRRAAQQMRATAAVSHRVLTPSPLFDVRGIGKSRPNVSLSHNPIG